jgi:uncharacterized membrane protein
MFKRIRNVVMDLDPIRYLRIVAILAAAIAVAQAAPLSTYKTIRYPGCATYGDSTELWGINDSGQIIGVYRCSSGSGAFLFSSGTLTAIAAPGATHTYVRGINNSGQIVGWYTYPVNGVPEGGEQGFLYSGGIFTPINPPSGVAFNDVVLPFGINDMGDIVGYYNATTGGWAGFLYKGGIFTSFRAPGETNTFATGVNNIGQIVGYTIPDPSTRQHHGFLYDGTKFITVDVAPATAPGANGTTPYKINNLGAVTGQFQPPAQLPLAFTYFNDGGLVTYEIPSANATGFGGINSNGTVVGSYIDNVGKPECGLGIECGLVATPRLCGS